MAKSRSLSELERLLDSGNPGVHALLDTLMEAESGYDLKAQNPNSTASRSLQELKQTRATLDKRGLPTDVSFRADALRGMHLLDEKAVSNGMSVLQIFERLTPENFNANRSSIDAALDTISSGNNSLYESVKLHRGFFDTEIPKRFGHPSINYKATGLLRGGNNVAVKTNTCQCPAQHLAAL